MYLIVLFGACDDTAACAFSLPDNLDLTEDDARKLVELWDYTADISMIFDTPPRDVVVPCLLERLRTDLRSGVNAGSRLWKLDARLISLLDDAEGTLTKARRQAELKVRYNLADVAFAILKTEDNS